MMKRRASARTFSCSEAGISSRSVRTLGVPGARTGHTAGYPRPVAVPNLAVAGSINLDLVAQAERLPRPGETVSGASFSRVPGGKGANQAVAAARLGADVSLVACVGRDGVAEEALAGLREAGGEARGA